LAASPAWAQTDRGFVRGLGGLTFGTAEASSIVGGGAGVTIGSNLQIVGEIGRINDVLPSEIRDQLDLLTALLVLETGLPVSLDVTAPAVYGLGGLRFNFPMPGRISPFVEGQVGVANISFDVNAKVAGIDISREVENEADIDSATKLLVGLGGGLQLRINEAFGVDVGYRYGRIFTDDPAVNTNAVYAALRIAIR
jgi:opacity protein-like surface antigen